MGDIEEIGQGVDMPRGANDKDINKALVFPKNRDMNSSNRHSDGVDECKNSVPGTQKIWVKTYGCSHNVSDSEYMEGILSNYGYRLTGQDEADLWLINSCTVKDPSEAAFMHLVNKEKQRIYQLLLLVVYHKQIHL